jgi:uncharacterized protein (TIGR03437 family)
MQTSFRRILFSFLPTVCLLAAGSSLMAYPVAITINVTFSDIPGDADPLGLGTATPPTALITSTIDSASAQPGATSASYPATVYVTVPALSDLGLTDAPESGTLTINVDGTITATFSQTNSKGATIATFNAVAVTGLSLASPVPTAFGTANFSAPASTTTYSAFGANGTVGITGTISAVGLTASPLTPISVSYQSGATAPAGQQIAISSNDPANPTLAYSVAVGTGSNGSSTSFLQLSETSGTTPGNVTATFSTSVAPGTYTADILINTTADTTGAPLSIPVTYTVTASNTPQLLVSPGSLSFQFTPGGSTSASKSISLTASIGVLSYSASITSGNSYLSVSPASGSSPGSINVTANAGALSVGTYSGAVQVSASGVAAVTIPVTVTVGAVGGSGITAIPTSLIFDYIPGQSTPPSQTIQLSSATPVSFNVSNVALYLPVTPVEAETNATLTVTLNPSGLSAGTYFNNLQINSSGGTISIPITVNVGPSALLGLSQFSLGFTYPATSDSPLTQTFSVSGSPAVTFTATSQSPWLTITPSSTTTPATVSVTANPNGLPAGTLTGTILIGSTEARNSPATVYVTFQVNQAGQPVLSVAPAAVAFAYQSGGIVPASQTVQISSNPPGAAYTVSGFGASWLNVSQISSAGVTTATLSVNPAGLNAGVYTGSLLIAGDGISNSPVFVPVTLTVSPNPTLGTSPTSLTFNAQPKSTVSISETVAVSSSFASSVTVSPSAAWLSASLAGGNTPTTLTVTANPTSMAAGSYTGSVTITGSGANPPVVILPVSLVVSATPAPVLAAVTNGITYANQIGAPGLIVSLWGTGLGPTPPAPLQLANPTTIATSAGGTQVLADGIPCPILFASAQQVNAILPFSLAGQLSTSIQVQYQGATSNALTIPVQPAAPGLFSENGTGSGAGAILNQNLSLNTSTNPAAQGSIVVLYGGGGGQTNPGGADGLIVPATTPIPAPELSTSVTIGGQPATVLYAGDAPDEVSGVLQFNVVLPSGLASGPQPVVVTIGGVSSQANLTVFVQ